MLAGGIGLRVPAGSVGWWLTRPLWVVAMAAVTLPFLAAFGRFERPRRRLPTPPAWRAVLGVVGICAGLGLLAYFGIGGEGGLNWPALCIAAAGAVAGGVVGVPERE
jgi:hypothetical protein